MSMDTFKKQLGANPALYAKEVLLVDEGDTLLVQEINQQLSTVRPKHLVLLSAVPWDALTDTQ